MAKSIAVFYPDNNQEHAEVLMAFYLGIKKHVPDAEWLRLDQYKPVDIAVVFGVGKKDVPVSYPRAKVIAAQDLAAKQVIVLEKGYVCRDGYYAAGLNGLNGRADFRNECMPSDRWHELGIGLAPWQYNPDGHVVVCGQVPSDASVQNINIMGWCANTIAQLMHQYNMNVIFRQHPLTPPGVPAINDVFNSKRTYYQDLQGAKAVVTFNSNAAVEAAIAGIPVFAFDEGSMALPIANTMLQQINDPLTPLREQWAFDLAYAQWTKKEMEDGLPWLHLNR